MGDKFGTVQVNDRNRRRSDQFIALGLQKSGKNLKLIWINTRKLNGKESWIRILKTSLRLTDEMEALKAKRVEFWSIKSLTC